ncbi:MAG: metallophosphoesterase family protein [Candidatus Eremiobacteraeota bacterium]|nr:metallophosphoesterase family protein [Candidatus Eremiobacteraeota bacterium]MBV9057408.1 metallophosphoesterase family protein [Candidatus Eremiobacteraeota bacterium]MBV9699237.1 metallophosphoesterase family protein [Candidatus Eremiobacteraeota bacterium]
MRIAALSDIHGNLLGLDACLADLASQGGADAVVVAGDLCLDGPKPKKVLQRLEEIGAACVRGNTDRYIGDDASEEKFSQMEASQIAWTRREIGDRWCSWLQALPFALRIGDDANQLLIVHANPTTDDEHLWPDAGDAELERLIGSEAAAAIAFGHLHLPYARMWRGKVLVNVASAGLPKDGDPRAGYAILTERPGGWEVKHRRVAFDTKRVATQLANCGIPGSDELIATLRHHRYKKLKNYIP